MTLRDPHGTAYDLTGPDGAPVVVLVHGLGLNRAVWQWMIPDLAQRFRVLTFDFLGHGESPPPPASLPCATCPNSFARCLTICTSPRLLSLASRLAAWSRGVWRRIILTGFPRW